jgi:hypothetical protein
LHYISMMDKYGDIQTLRKEFGNHKEIPAKYEEEILIALAHYPELKDEHIQFVLSLAAPVPYGTKPTLASFFAPKDKREYTITILESAEAPEKEALMKHLDKKMRIGVFGHELAHVLQYKNCTTLGLLKTLSLYLVGSYKRRLERSADKVTIKHGLGEELLRHAEYIRLIPEYMEKRPDLNRDYLKPEEIVFYISHPEKIAVA